MRNKLHFIFRRWRVWLPLCAKNIILFFRSSRLRVNFGVLIDLLAFNPSETEFGVLVHNCEVSGSICSCEGEKPSQHIYTKLNFSIILAAKNGSSHTPPFFLAKTSPQLWTERRYRPIARLEKCIAKNRQWKTRLSSLLARTFFSLLIYNFMYFWLQSP